MEAKRDVTPSHMTTAHLDAFACPSPSSENEENLADYLLSFKNCQHEGSGGAQCSVKSIRDDMGELADMASTHLARIERTFSHFTNTTEVKICEISEDVMRSVQGNRRLTPLQRQRWRHQVNYFSGYVRTRATFLKAPNNLWEKTGKFFQNVRSCLEVSAKAVLNSSDNLGRSSPEKNMLEDCMFLNYCHMLLFLTSTGFSNHIHRPYPSQAELNRLAYETLRTPLQIQNWFKNQRKRRKVTLKALTEKYIRSEEQRVACDTAQAMFVPHTEEMSTTTDPIDKSGIFIESEDMLDVVSHSWPLTECLSADAAELPWPL